MSCEGPICLGGGKGTAYCTKKPFDVVAGTRKHQLSPGQSYSVYDLLAKMFLTSKFNYLLFLPTPPIKLKLGLQICAKLVKISTHLEQPDQTNYLANHQQVLRFTLLYLLPESAKMLARKPFC